MIKQLSKTTAEQRKLALSLGTNFATRIPGALGVLFFLPLLRFDLGTKNYGILLASLALGAAATFLFGGFSLVGRRFIGECYSRGDKAGEADGFTSLLLVNLCALFLSSTAIFLYTLHQKNETSTIIASLIPAILAFFNTFDNVRAAYNEHYITATLQFVLQIFVYSIGFLVSAARHNLIFSAIILQGHYIVASIIALLLLLRQRPYLLHGRPKMAWQIARQGILLSTADGFMMATLSASVVWIQARCLADQAAWYATVVRLFQTFLVPVILLLMPLSSYVRLQWNSKTIKQQRYIIVATIILGSSYGLIVASALILIAKFYAGQLLHLPQPGAWWEVLPIFLMFGAIVTYKTYSSIAYLVLDVSQLSTTTSIAVATSVCLAVMVHFILNPIQTIGIYGIATAILIIGMLIWSVTRFLRESVAQSGVRTSFS